MALEAAPGLVRLLDYATVGNCPDFLDPLEREVFRKSLVCWNTHELHFCLR
jgi:hypothetical protein